MNHSTDGIRLRPCLAQAGAKVVTVARTGPALAELATTSANIRTEVKEQDQVQARGVRAMTSRGATTVSLERLTRLADQGYLTVPVGKTFPRREVQQAHQYAQSGQGRGRFVLRVVEENHLIS